ncbi:MAG: hypothetical protein WBV85_02215 [Solirubrobacteraceae bacterium]
MAADQNDTQLSEAAGQAFALASQGSGSTASERLTGFEPDDRRMPAPDRVPSALETFRAAPVMEPVTEVDPMAALSEKERKEHHEEINGIVKAQRDAETLVGITMRR